MRRGLVATTVGLAVLVLLLALQAVPGGASGTHLRTEAPRPGDRAVYAVQGEGPDAGGTLDVRAGDPMPVLDGLGAARAVVPFALDAGADGTPALVWTDAGTGAVVARGPEAVLSQASWMVNRYVGANVATSDGASEVTVLTQDLGFGAPRDPAALCGLRHAAQGASVALDARLDVPDCGTSLRFAGVHAVGGIDAYRFKGQSDGGRVELWLHPGVPYPLQARLGDGAQARTFVLEGFTAGPRPLVTPEVGPAPAAAAVTLAPPTRFGPALGGAQHPFPVEAAVEAVLANAVALPTRGAEQAFAAWWAAHPAAVVHEAAYAETSDGEYLLRGWDLLLGDAGSGASLRVVLEAAEGQATLLPWSLSSPWRNNLQVAFEEGLPPAAGPLPAQAPTVAAAMAAWERHRTPGFAADDPTGWGFRLTCADGAASCPAPGLHVDAGHIRFLTPADPVVDAPGVLAYNEAVDADSQVVRLGPAGEILGLRTVHRSEVVDTGGLVALPDLEEHPAADRAGTASGDVASPLALAATLAVAGAVALTVLLWPALKALGAGLFSRIQGPRVLEHPGRAAIVDAIHADPGLHFSELARRTGHAAGALRHHLAKLQDAGLVVARPLGGYLCYFAPGTSRESSALANAAARSEGARRVLEAQQAGIVGVRAIAAHTGLSPSTVSHHLARLRQGADDPPSTPAE